MVPETDQLVEEEELTFKLSSSKYFGFTAELSSVFGERNPKHLDSPGRYNVGLYPLKGMDGSSTISCISGHIPKSPLQPPIIRSEERVAPFATVNKV